ncbi:uncharacterized protein LOC131317627 [Rhododendron vialii]|uniref:uncharacterized protein LOC131317627 n=1 Tax=Rhododendron vialii TaxID=182163 RepID=UPI00265D7EBD|nr:uncharacterized protein LOC131317627 [Rhododendron vialii]
MNKRTSINSPPFAHARLEFASHLFCPELVLDANPTLAISAWRKSSNDSLKIKDAAFNCNGFNATGWLFKITGGRWWMILIEDSRCHLSFKENSLRVGWRVLWPGIWGFLMWRLSRIASKPLT